MPNLRTLLLLLLAATCFALDSKPVVLNPTTGNFRNIPTGDRLVLPDASGDLVTLDVGVQAGARTISLPIMPGNSIFAVSAAALTSGRVPFVTTDGLLTDSASLTYASSQLTNTLAMVLTGSGIGAGTDVNFSITRSGHTTGGNRCTFQNAANTDNMSFGIQGSSDHPTLSWVTANTSYIYAPSGFRVGQGSTVNTYAEYTSTVGWTVSLAGTAGIAQAITAQARGNGGNDRGVSYGFSIPSGTPGTRAAGVIGVAAGSTTTSYMRFDTEIASAVAERARISAAGNLLVGATADTGITGAGGLRVANTTSASSSTVGAAIIGDLTAATTVAIGGGKVNIGDTGTSALTMAGGINGGASTRIYYGGTNGTPTSASSLTYATAGLDRLIAGGGTQRALIEVNGSASSLSGFGWQSAGNARWRFEINNAEGGSDSGSDILWQAFTDAGATIDTPLTITRAALGGMAINRPVTITPGAAAPLTLVGGTATTNLPVISGTQTWNAGGSTFNGITLDITDTASAFTSKLFDLKVGGTTRFSVDKHGNLRSTQAAMASTAIAFVNWVAGAHTSSTASTEASDIIFDLARTQQWATGALTTQRAFRVMAPTYAFVGASTITNAATVAISGAPVAGTNATLTNAWALWVQGGTTRLDGALEVSSTTLIKSNTTLTNGAGAGAGTITNAPAAGNPTKWIPINDNGTTRYIPAW